MRRNQRSAFSDRDTEFGRRGWGFYGSTETLRCERSDIGGNEAIRGDGGGQGQPEKVVGDGFGGGGVAARPDGDGGEGAAQELRAEGEEFFRNVGAEGGHAFLDGACRDGILAVELPGGGAGAGREGKKMQV